MFFIWFLLQELGKIKANVYFEKPKTTTVNIKSKEYLKIESEGMEFTSIPGKPLLPVKTFIFIVPPNADEINVSLMDIKVDTFSLELPILPAQKPVPFFSNWKDFITTIEPENEYYNKDQFIPVERINGLKIGNKGGFKIVYFQVYPYRYNPVSSRLEVMSEAEIVINYKEGKNVSFSPSKKQLDVHKVLLEELVYNKEDIERFSPPIMRNLSTTLPPDNYEYVIISGSSAFNNSFRKLAEWKKKKGIKTKIVNIDWIISNYSGYDKAEKLRNFMKDAYSTWGTIWFLLGGQGDWEWEEEYVPRRDLFYAHLLMPVYYPDQETIPGDIYFSNLDGNWDFNNNHIYGEEGDSVDLFSDVFVGRLPCKDVESAENMVNKILVFEKKPPFYFVKRVLFPASLLFPPYNWWGDSVNNAIANITPPGWSDIKLYQSQGNLTQKGIIDTLNSGVQFTHYALHGGPGAVGDADGNVYLSINDIDTLHNGDNLSIQTGISCFTGALDEVFWDDNDCFAEHFLTKIRDGGVASIMNSRFGWGNPASGKIYFSEAIDTAFYHQIFKKSHIRLGEALNTVKDFYGARATFDSLWLWCIYELNLFGDPELRIWTDNPETLSVLHPDFIPPGNVNFSINVSHNGIPVDSAIVCCMMDTVVYAVETTNVSGIANFSLSIPFSGNLEITVTKQNFYPYEGNIKVIGNEGIVFLNYEVFDTILNADNNKEINSGEIVDIPVWIRNNTLSNYSGLSGKLKIFSSYVSIIKDSVNFLSILSGDSVISNGAFRIQVSSFTPEEFFVPCSLIISKDAETWYSCFLLLVKGQKIINLNPNEIIFDYRYKNKKLSSYLDTIFYDDGNPTKQIYFSTYPYMGVRFIPNPGCTLLQALVGRSPIITNFYDKLFLRQDNAGIPGAVIDSFFYMPDKYADSGFTEVPLFNPYRPYVFQNPFWVVINDQGTSNGTMLGDAAGSGNSFVSTNGSNWQSYNSDFLIRVLVKTFTPKSLTDSSILWVKNDGSATLTIEKIELKNNSSWFYSKKPEFLAIPPFDSSKIVIRVDTIGLSKEQNYFDTLIIYSDASYENKFYSFISAVPISILYKNYIKIPRISLISYSIYDTVSSSNSNGVVEPGEIIDICGTIKNIGDTTGYSIFGKLIDNDIYTSFIDSVEDFGNVIPLEEKTFRYRLSISYETPLGHSVSCSLKINDANDSIWAVSLNFLVGKGPVISFSADSILFDYSKKNGIKSQIDTIIYDAGPLWDVSTYSYYGVRFTPASLCSVKSAIVCIDNVLGYSGDTIMVMDDNGGLPGTIISKTAFTPLTGSNLWNKIDLPPYIDDNDFWIVAKLRTTYQGMNNDQGDATITERSYYSSNGSSWIKNTSSDFCIRGIVSYFTQSYEWNDTGFIFVRNIGDTTLTIDSINTKLNSNWIKSIFPRNSSILKGDSVKISVIIDTAGLSPIRYSDTLIFFTNAIGVSKGTNAKLPVILNFYPLGIELISVNAINEKDGILLIWEAKNVEGGDEWIIKRKDTDWNIIGNLKVMESSDGIYRYKDRNVVSNMSYIYQVGLKLKTGEIKWSKMFNITANLIPEKYSFQIIGNVSRSKIIFSYGLPMITDVRIRVIDITGRIKREIKYDNQEPGCYISKMEIQEEGIYFIKFQTGGYEETKKIIILR